MLNKIEKSSLPVDLIYSNKDDMIYRKIVYNKDLLRYDINWISEKLNKITIEDFNPFQYKISYIEVNFTKPDIYKQRRLQMKMHNRANKIEKIYRHKGYKI